MMSLAAQANFLGPLLSTVLASHKTMVESAPSRSAAAACHALPGVQLYQNVAPSSAAWTIWMTANGLTTTPGGPDPLDRLTSISSVCPDGAPR